MNRRARWVAPADSGGVLIDPPLDQAPRILEQNRQILDSAPVVLSGVSLREIRARRFRNSTYEKAPSIVTGHQPEFFHPGVWIKNFIQHGLAQRHGWFPLHVTIDTDQVKSTGMRFPSWHADPAQVRTTFVEFDDPAGEQIYYHCRIQNQTKFREFARASEPIWSHWPFRPVLARLWSHMQDKHAADWRYTLLDHHLWVREQLEQNWGCRNFNGLMSRHDHHLLTSHILADLPRFHAVYNSCVQGYRRHHRLRSRTHPVPNLAIAGEFLEAPFWWYDSGDQRRHRLFARPHGDRIDLMPGPNSLDRVVAISRTRPDFRDVLRGHGVVLFTRALTTSMYLRLCVADLFIHGIGGAKYDEVTDDIICRYFAIEPPTSLVASGTLHLPFRRFPERPGAIQLLHRQLRDLHWHPERFLDHANTHLRDRIAEKINWLHKNPTSGDERRMRYQALLHLTESLRPAVAQKVEQVQRDLESAELTHRANEVLFRRDYPFVLFPEDLLQSFCTQFLK